MDRERVSIEDLIVELERLQLAAHNIERLIHQAEEQVNPVEPVVHQANRIIDIEVNRRANINYTGNHLVVRDTNDTEILIGDKVRFLTSGVYDSWTGVVYKVSSNGARVTARDERGRSISRAPSNVEVIEFRHE